MDHQKTRGKQGRRERALARLLATNPHLERPGNGMPNAFSQRMEKEALEARLSGKPARSDTERKNRVTPLEPAPARSIVTDQDFLDMMDRATREEFGYRTVREAAVAHGRLPAQPKRRRMTDQEALLADLNSGRL